MKSLYVRVLIAIALGVVVGLAMPDIAADLDIVGTGFVKLVKMTIAPLIFCTIVVGIAGMKSMKSVGKAGGLALIYFEVVSTIALVIGLVVINVVQPGSDMHVHLTSDDASKVAEITKKKLDAAQMILDDIPDGFFGALAKGDLIPVLVIAMLFGFALHRTGERGKPVLDMIDRASHVIFEMIGLVMLLAPVGAFGAMASTVAKFGVGTLVPLLELMACFYATCLTFVFGVLGLVARLHGFSIIRYLGYIWEELLIVLGTSSSESVLPRMMRKLEAAGASKSVVGLVIPTGYSFNLDGTAIYLTMAAVFLAQATDTPMPIANQIALLGVLLLTSKGAAGVTGSGFVVLSATLGAVGDVPPEAIVIILGIDRFMSEARALTNVCGNGVATLVVAKWCNELDEPQLQRTLG